MFKMNFVVILFLIPTLYARTIDNKVEESTDFPVYEFKCDILTGFCHGYALNLNETHTRFTPISTIPAEKVKIVHLGGHPSFFHDLSSSVMHTLTSDLCRTFPNLKIIDAKYLNLHEIESDALRECTQLEAIYLGSNNLQHLDQTLFKHNKNLEKIRLEDNKLTKLDLNLFEELRHLNELGFDGILLSNFHVNKIRHRGIIKLVLRFNDKSLIDLDELRISKNYQHLSSFIPCYQERSNIYYIRLLEAMFEPYAKLYCFERPGTLNEDGKVIVERSDSLINTVDNRID